jgi:hypothetical protein
MSAPPDPRCDMRTEKAFKSLSMDFSFIYGDVRAEQISQPILPSEV